MVQPAIEPMCPACAVPLEVHSVNDAGALRCPTCYGLFVDHLALEAWMRDGAVNAPTETEENPCVEALHRVRYRRCSRCAVMMNRVNFAPATALVLDVCLEHGYWLDAGKLTKMVAHVRTRGVGHTALARVEAQRKERRRLAELRDAVGLGVWEGVPWREEGTFKRMPNILLRTLLRMLIGW
jgi:Zn-finger nucleic acid-binding protein